METPDTERAFGVAAVGHIVAGLRANHTPPEYIEHVITEAITNNEHAKEKADEEKAGIAELRHL